MLPATEEEKARTIAYYLSQSPDAEVSFVQKVYSESVIGHRHDVWDLHASDGRWWIITNPTNLYSQAQFPNMDLAVTFHIGLCLRIPRTEQKRKSDSSVVPFAGVFEGLREAGDALGQAKNLGDYQSIGVRSREALLTFVAAAQDAAQWTTDAAPKRGDFRAWSELICNATLSNSAQKDRRRLFKALLAEAWVFANWLTHSKSATWHDAEAALATAEHALGLATSLVLRHVRSVPELCPKCGSSNLSPEEGWHQDRPEIVWERPVCSDCGWTGMPVVVGTRTADADGDPIFTREGGGDQDGCIVPTMPLTNLMKPGES